MRRKLGVVLSLLVLFGISYRPLVVTATTEAVVLCDSPIVVSSESEFTDAYQKVSEGVSKCIELSADVTVSASGIELIQSWFIPGDFMFDGKGHTIKFEFTADRATHIFRVQNSSENKEIVFKDLIIEAANLNDEPVNYSDSAELIRADLYGNTIDINFYLQGVNVKTPESGRWNDIVSIEGRFDNLEDNVSVYFSPGDIITQNVFGENSYNSSIVYGANYISFQDGVTRVAKTSGTKLGAPFVGDANNMLPLTVDVMDGATVEIVGKTGNSHWIFKGLEVLNVMSGGSLSITNGDNISVTQLASGNGTTINVFDNANLTIENTSSIVFNDFSFDNMSRVPFVINGNPGSSINIKGQDGVAMFGNDGSKINLISPRDYNLESTGDSPIITTSESDVARLIIQSNVTLWKDTSNISPEFLRTFNEDNFQVDSTTINSEVLSVPLKDLLLDDFDFNQYRAVRYAVNPEVSATDLEILVGDKSSVNVTVVPWLSDSSVELVYTSEDGTVLSVDASGNIVGLKPGESRVFISITETGKFRLVSGTYITVLVNDAPEIIIPVDPTPVEPTPVEPTPVEPTPIPDSVLPETGGVDYTYPTLALLIFLVARKIFINF